jgi:hypothetical protein
MSASRVRRDKAALSSGCKPHPARSPRRKGAAFGWHRLTLPQLAFAIAAPILVARGLTPLSRIGAAALVARLVHRMNMEGRLSHYRSVATTPGFPRAVAGVITELRLARIPLDAVGACAPDLASLIDAYKCEALAGELAEGGLVDPDRGKFKAARGNDPILAAITLLRNLNQSGKREVPPDAPLPFRKEWRRLQPRNGHGL